ncbi:MAG: beta-ketoacyl synthase N-terminal-like domain-containing protein, partial [Exilibacterium sp.]
MNKKSSPREDQPPGFGNLPDRRVESTADSINAEDRFREQVADYLKHQLSEVIGLPAHRIEVNAELEKYGIDSLMVVKLSRHLEQEFGALSKTLLFEYRTLGALAGYFLESHRARLLDLLPAARRPVYGVASTDPIPEAAVAAPAAVAPEVFRSRPDTGRLRAPSPPPAMRGDVNRRVGIAITGLAGRYPQAANPREFWANLRAGKNCITEIPTARWDHNRYFDPDKTRSGKSYSKWGGFIDGVDCFDPLFFNISHREAEIIDPQERLFLQCAYETLEDAGYTRESLLGNTHGDGADTAGRQVGVYVGVMYEEYQLYGEQAARRGGPAALGGISAAIANRVSYYFNFNGPSMAVDTMCSSSLSAIHLACQSLQLGQCELALAGGVNVSVHPNKYLMLSEGKFASSKGLCESFGEGGDGYVPGEGVGAVLLKPLAVAEADGDHIYAVIRGTAINHGGKTNGFTVPNPTAQAAVIGRACRAAGIDPRSIGYLEAHGTGTALGDPIEITGLTKAFRRYTRDTGFCAIGSVKSNIGHCESAAGIAGLTKVLLQLEHGQLVPSLHAGTLNPNIDFDDTPFVVQRALSEWRRPRLPARAGGESGAGRDGMREYPRRAGVSSFGAGGANAHILVEEYIDGRRRPIESGRAGASDAGESGAQAAEPALILLSGADRQRLRAVAGNLNDYLIDNRPLSTETLRRVAYTLQTGREALEERLAILVHSADELERKLKEFLAGEDNVAGLFLGQVKRHKEALAVFNADEDTENTLTAWMAKKIYARLLEFWVNGGAIDWRGLYGEDRPRRISLPTYPFARERCWIPQGAESMADGPVESGRIHPLLHCNTSNFFQQRFSATFTGTEVFLNDHRVGGRRVLPGAVCLEMAAAALATALALTDEERTAAAFELRDVVWSRPVVVADTPVTIHISLLPRDNGEAAFEIYSETDAGGVRDAAIGERVIHCAGRCEYRLRAADNPARVGSATAHAEGSSAWAEGSLLQAEGSRQKDGSDSPPPALDLRTLTASCHRRRLTAAQCYQLFNTLGIDYGPGHRAIEEIRVGDGRALAKISLPAHLAGDPEEFALHPSLLDAALQASVGLLREGEEQLALPFALRSLALYARLPASLWALVSHERDSVGGGQRPEIDIDLCDAEGRVCARLRGFSTRAAVPQAFESSLSGVEGTRSGVEGFQSQAQGFPGDGVRRQEEMHTSQHWVIFCAERDSQTRQTLRADFAAELDGIELAGLDSTPADRAPSMLDQVPSAPDQAHRFADCTAQLLAIIQDIAKCRPGQPTLLQVVVSESQARHFACLCETLKTARRENPLLIGQFIEFDLGSDPGADIGERGSDHRAGGEHPAPDTEPTFIERLLAIPGDPVSAFIGVLRENGHHPDDIHIRYRHGEREVVGLDHRDPADTRVDTTVDTRVDTKGDTTGDTTGDTANGGFNESLLRGKTLQYLKKQLSGVLKVPFHRLEGDAPLEKYGIDSVLVMKLTGELENTFGDLSKTLLFEHQTLDDLSGYFMRAHRETLMALLSLDTAPPRGGMDGLARDSAGILRTDDASSAQSALPAKRTLLPGKESEGRTRDRLGDNIQERASVAIIGLAGRYPGADNLAQFWANLKAGRDCITEIPRDRW